MIDLLKKLFSSPKESKPKVKKATPKKRKTQIVRSVNKLNEPYDFNTFIEVFIYTTQTYVHEDFDKYYEGLFKSLEKLFSTNIKTPEDHAKYSLWNLMKSTINSYLEAQTPMSNYIEAGLLMKRIRESGSKK